MAISVRESILSAEGDRDEHTVAATDNELTVDFADDVIEVVVEEPIRLEVMAPDGRIVVEEVDEDALLAFLIF